MGHRDSWARKARLVLLLPAFAVAGQGLALAQATTKATTALRTPWGQPNLQGIWTNHSITPLERPAVFGDREFLTEAEAAELEQKAATEANDEARQSGERDVSTAYNDFWWDRATTVVGTRRTSLITDPRDGKVPALTPEASARQAVERDHRPLRATGGFEGGRGGDSWTDRSLWERCITQGLPRVSSNAYNSNIAIVQTPDVVAIQYEMIHETRLVPLDGRPHSGNTLRQWMGESRGHWEGNTLVVDTTHFTDNTNFRGSTSGLHMIERFTRVDERTLNYEVTFDDPATWTRPWRVAIPWRQANGEMYEYACHEGNYGMYGILAGARKAEQTEARKPSN